MLGFTLLGRAGYGPAKAQGGAPPANSVAPSITGTARVGQTLSCSTGTWTGGGSISYAYQWKAAGVDISGATASTCQLTSAELGKVIACRVTASNAAGSASATSAATAAVVAGDFSPAFSSAFNI